jgi:formyltetrahydrofolate hydrolase
MEVQYMDFVEKARIRLEHWIAHNVSHQEEYEEFMEQLQDAGEQESADHIREMIALAEKSTHCLRNALNALGA